MQISIKHNFPDVQRALDGLSADVRDRVVSSTINRVLDLGRTQMARSIAQEFNVKQAYAKERLRIRRATSKRGTIFLEGALIGTGKRSANIIAFLERSTSLAQGRKRGKAGTKNQLHVKVKRTGSAKPIKGAFIGNKGRTVFQRVGKERLPIKAVQVIDIPQMFTTKRINQVVVKLMLERFPEIFARDAKFFVARFSGSGGLR